MAKNTRGEQNLFFESINYKNYLQMNVNELQW